MTAVAAQERKAYVFGKRGVSRELHLKRDKRSFMAKFRIRYCGQGVTGGELTFRWEVERLEPSVTDAFMKIREKQVGVGLYLDTIEFKEQMALQAKLAVEINDVSGDWKTAGNYTYQSGGKSLSTAFDPTDRDHFNQAVKRFDEAVRQDDSPFARALDRYIQKVLIETENEIGGIIARLQEKPSNEDLRKHQTRNNNEYDTGHKIMLNLFKGGFHSIMASGGGSGGTPFTTVEVGTSPVPVNGYRSRLFYPPFAGAMYTNAAGQHNQTHTDGPTSFLITFGVDPWPFIVLLTATIMKVGSNRYVSTDNKMWAVGLVKQRFYAQEIRADFRMEESKLEMACVLAISSVLKGKP